jgi:hypothetical protein
MATVAIAALLSNAPVKAEEEPSVTPYRPTVSNPAALPEPGWLDVEIGFNLNGIYSTNFGGHTVDLNLNATRLGAIEPGTGRTQWGWATSISRPLNEQWNVAAELSGISRQGAPVENQALFAVGYSLSKRVVLDAGFTRGLSLAAADHSYFFGVSSLLDKIR